MTFPLSARRLSDALIRAGQELAGHRPLEELFDVILNLALSAVEAKRGVILTPKTASSRCGPAGATDFR